MNAIAAEIFDQLDDDIISYSWLAQVVEQMVNSCAPLQLQIQQTLAELLSSGLVEIGNTEKEINHVAFVAWRGTIDERIQRAERCLFEASERDRAFAYWLCLRENVDRFEDAHGP